MELRRGPGKVGVVVVVGMVTVLRPRFCRWVVKRLEGVRGRVELGVRGRMELGVKV